MERDDVVARDGLDRLLGRRLPERVRAAVQNSREDARGDGTRLRFGLIELHQPLRAQPLERRLPGTWELSSMSARMSSVAPNFADVDWNVIVPLSPPTTACTEVPSSCSAFDSASPSRVVVPSLSIAAVKRADAAAVGRLELIRAAEERDRERHERQIVLLGHDQLGAVGERARGPRRHAQSGRLARRRDLRAVERRLRRQRRDREGGARPHHQDFKVVFIAGPPDVARCRRSLSCSPRASTPDPACPIGTTLNTTRPWVRYWFATRLTSAAVTASDF